MIILNKLSKFYNKNDAEGMIRRRYENSVPSIRITLKHFVPTKEFQEIKNSFRSKGWKDWHILMGIFNFIMNYRMEKMGILGNLQAMIKFQELYPYQEESQHSIQIPMSVITEKNIMNGLEMSIPATLSALGFSIPPDTRIEKNKLLKILEKFNYWENDVEHEPLFDL